MLKGIDISNYQRNNYKRLIDTYAKDFVITRAAWRYSVDPMCDVMYQYAKSRGKQLGFYFFPLTSDGNAEKHAEWAYKMVLGYINEAIPILDWESYNGLEGTNDHSRVDWALRWLKRFEELSGVKPMIYMNSNCNSLFNWKPVVDNNNGLWIANYGTRASNAEGRDNGRPPVKFWRSAAMHQYTSLGDNGSSLDKDTFYGDKFAWSKYAESHKTQTSDKPAPAPIPKTYTEDEVKMILSQAESKYQQEIDDTLEKLHQVEAQFGVCKEIVKDAKKGINAILDYEG